MDPAFTLQPSGTLFPDQAGLADPAAWYARRPWTANYPSFIPQDLHVDPQEMVLDLLLASCDRYADRVAFEIDGHKLTYRQWREASDVLARFFVHAWNLQVGDRVLFMMTNGTAFPIALLGAWMAGLGVMAVYAAATSTELEGPIAAIQPKAIVVLDSLVATSRAARGAEALHELVVPDPSISTTATDSLAPAVTLAAALAKGATFAPVRRRFRSSDLALMAYTGGTTGVSKAVRITHANMRAGIEMLRYGLEGMAAIGTAEGALVVSVHPFAHSAGMSVQLLQFASKGATQLCFPKPFDTEAVVTTWRTRPINCIFAGPAFFNKLMATPGFAELDFSALNAAFVGGMPLRPDIRERWEAMTGKPLLQGYGLTETSAPIAGEFGHARHVGSVGFPFPSVQITIRDPDAPDLAAVDPGTMGEVWVRGPFLMSGYHERPDETARAITADGWFRTGDLGRMNPQGALYLLGRIKDMILVDGANVYPAALEAIIGAHPGIADVCAVGMPDEQDGERVRLFVVRRDPALDEASVAAWCATHLSHFKQPKRIEFIDALPRSAVDKTLRRELSERPLS
jgi:long-chain acyl-CoA synthetase